MKEADKLLDHIEDDLHLYTIIYLALYTELRRGELIALRWKNIDLENNRLFVRESVNEVRGKGLIFKEPKNDSNKKTIDFDENVTALLKHYLKKTI